MLELFSFGADDLSIRMLNFLFSPILSLFNDYGTTAASTTGISQAFSAGFTLFNQAMAFLASAYVLIHTASAIIRTAHEGEVMGKSWSTSWVPLRIGFGYFVLIPLSSGYSLIQVAIMFFTLSGVGLANSLSTVMTTMFLKADVTTTVQLTQPPPSQMAYKLASESYKSLSCVQYGNEYISGKNASWGYNIAPMGLSEVIIEGEKNTYFFGGVPNAEFGGNYPLVNTGININEYRLTAHAINDAANSVGNFFASVPLMGSITQSAGEFLGGSFSSDVCGKITYLNPASLDESTLDSVYGGDSTAIKQFKSEFANVYNQALRKMISSLGELVYSYYVNDKDVNAVFDDKEYAMQFDAAAAEFDNTIKNWVKTKLTPDPVNNDKLTTNIADNVTDEFIVDLLKDGWISQGAAYFRMSKITEEINGTIDGSSLMTVGSRDRYRNQDGSYTNNTSEDELIIEIQPKLADAEARMNEWLSILNTYYKTINSTGSTLINPVTAYSQANNANSQNPLLDSFFESMFSIVGQNAEGLYMVMAPTGGANNHEDRIFFLEDAKSPIVVAQQLGNIFTAIGVSFLTAFFAASATMTSIGAAAISGGGSIGALLFVVPMMLVVVVSVLFCGLTFAYYVPMIPFIVWIGGIVSWLVSVLEAMIIAPIWAISFLSPEGDGFAGQKAEQGFLLILSVFLRPTLMIFGMFAALGVSFVVFAYINAVFMTVFIDASPSAFMSEIGIFKWFAKWIIYVILFITTMNTIYSLIHIIPDRVLRWIGGGDAPLGDMGVEQANKQAFGIAVGTGSQATSQGAGAMGNKSQAPTPDGDGDNTKTPGKDDDKQNTDAEMESREDTAGSNKGGKTAKGEDADR